MIGNDIVDLDLAFCSHRWENARVFEKIFDIEEQNIISKSKNPLQDIWWLWSMKESAYKSFLRRYKNPFFSPSKIACRPHSDNEGMVTIQDHKFFVRSVKKQEYVYSIALSKKETNLIDHCFRINHSDYKSQNQVTYKNLLSAFSESSGIKEKRLKIKKGKLGIPVIYEGSEVVNTSFSITHHGHFCAFVFEKV